MLYHQHQRGSAFGGVGKKIGRGRKLIWDGQSVGLVQSKISGVKDQETERRSHGGYKEKQSIGKRLSSSFRRDREGVEQDFISVFFSPLVNGGHSTLY